MEFHDFLDSKLKKQRQKKAQKALQRIIHAFNLSTFFLLLMMLIVVISIFFVLFRIFFFTV